MHTYCYSTYFFTCMIETYRLQTVLLCYKHCDSFTKPTVSCCPHTLTNNCHSVKPFKYQCIYHCITVHLQRKSTSAWIIDSWTFVYCTTVLSCVLSYRIVPYLPYCHVTVIVIVYHFGLTLVGVQELCHLPYLHITAHNIDIDIDI